MKTLVIGGARSGKSRYAQHLAGESGLIVVYIATATADDEEMQQRIALHREQRPDNWLLVEEPLQLVSVLEQYNDKKYCVLVDCLTLWMSNCLAAHEADSDSAVTRRTDELVACVKNFNAELILVSNEVGMGIVPMGQLSRQFVDESGRLHQQLAEVCEQVVMTVVGLPQMIKSAR